jgi:1-acyl-sn-glycerol-3-phosphate acyltransferase
MAWLRSILHLLWMGVTVVPWAMVVIVASLFLSSTAIYWMCAAWLRWAVSGARVILGIQVRVSGWDNLPQGQTSAAVLLVKHQSTFETFLMPTLMPHPLAYVFKKELLYVPFFGWAMGRLDMIHIDRSKRSEAFAKVVQQGRRLMAQGVWVIMFPEGTRIERGQQGTYKSGGARLAIECAGHPGGRDLGQMLAAQGDHQAARHGRCVHRPAHRQRRPQARRAHGRSAGLDRGRNAPARSAGLR